MKYYILGIIERIERFLIPTDKRGLRDAYKVEYLMLIGFDVFLFNDWWSKIAKADTLDAIGIFFYGLLAQFFLFIGIQLMCAIGYVVVQISIGYVLLNEKPIGSGSKHWRKSIPGYPVILDEEPDSDGHSWQNSIVGFAVSTALFYCWDDHIVLIVVVWLAVVFTLRAYQYLKIKLDETEDL